MTVFETAPGVGLTPEEGASLFVHEATLNAGLHLWQTAGLALLAISERHLYRAQAPSFEEYCRQRWGLAVAEALRLVALAEVYAQVRREAQVDLRSSAQADALRDVPDSQRAAVVRAAQATGRISARSLKLAASNGAHAPTARAAAVHTSRANGQTRMAMLPSTHRETIICADVRAVTAERLGEPPTLIIADPPYNISRNRNFQREGARTITSNFGEWDRMTTADFGALLEETINWSYQHSAVNASIYWFCSDKVLSDVHRYMEAAGWRDSVTIYWHKTNPAPHFMRNTYVSSVEVCVFARKGKPTFNWLGQNGMHNFAMENLIETPLVGGQERVRGPHGESLNLAQKSSKVIRRFMEVSSNPGELVLDLFAGTGTTSAVAEELGRRWLAIEQREEQCQIIEARVVAIKR